MAFRGSLESILLNAVDRVPLLIGLVDRSAWRRSRSPVILWIANSLSAVRETVSIPLFVTKEPLLVSVMTTPQSLSVGQS